MEVLGFVGHAAQQLCACPQLAPQRHGAQHQGLSFLGRTLLQLKGGDGTGKRGRTPLQRFGTEHGLAHHAGVAR